MNIPLSYSSVRLELFSKDGLRFNPASGFLVDSGEQHYLITNRHILADNDFRAAGREESAAKPYVLKTSVHSYGGMGEQRAPLAWGAWQRIAVPLYDDSAAPTWIEHPAKDADVVALPILLDDPLRLKLIQSLRAFGSKTTGINTNGDYWTRIAAIPVSTIDTEVDYGPPDLVHVIGYPLGWTPAGPHKSSQRSGEPAGSRRKSMSPARFRGMSFLSIPVPRRA